MEGEKRVFIWNVEDETLYEEGQTALVLWRKSRKLWYWTNREFDFVTSIETKLSIVHPVKIVLRGWRVDVFCPVCGGSMYPETDMFNIKYRQYRCIRDEIMIYVVVNRRKKQLYSW